MGMMDYDAAFSVFNAAGDDMSAMTRAAALLSMNYSFSQLKDTIRIWLSFKDHITTKNVTILIIPTTFSRHLNIKF
jgi:hypothetical protein